MTNEFAADLITLLDDDGQEHSFEILDIIENDEGCFYALLPNNQDNSLSAYTSYYIFEKFNENGEDVLTEVEDETLLNKLSNAFEARYENMYTTNDNNKKI